MVLGYDTRNINTGELLNRLEGHTSYISVLQILSDGRIASGKRRGGNGDIRIWHSQRQLHSILSGGTDSVRYILIFKDRLVTLARNSQINIWNEDTLEHTMTHEVYIHLIIQYLSTEIISGDAYGSIKHIYSNNK